jgi:6-pyruvoyl-tetrahydropterin synthase
MKKTLFYKNVSTLDFAYVVDSERVIGCSLYVDVQFEGSEDRDGVIYDFSIAKNRVKSLIDEFIDHRLIVPNKIVKEVADRYFIKIGMMEYLAPKEAFCLIDEEVKDEVKYKDIEKFAEKLILNELPDNISFIKITLREEVSDSSFFNYTHGLKNHYGNCQRLLHGHRNQIEIWTSNIRRGDLEKQFIKKYLSCDIHFVYFENVINKEELLVLNGDQRPHGKIDRGELVFIEYSSTQGKFSLKIPLKNCYFVDSETTIENMAAIFLKHVAIDYLINSDLKIVAYEGIGKGASCKLYDDMKQKT